MELLIWNMEEKWGAPKRQSKIKSLCVLPCGSLLKIAEKRAHLRLKTYALVHIQHPGLFWLIIRLLLGFQPPQTKIERCSRTTGLWGGGSLRCTAIYWMLFVLNWCNSSQLQVRNFSLSGVILEKASFKPNALRRANANIPAYLFFVLKL